MTAKEIIQKRIDLAEAMANTWKVNSQSDIYTKKEKAVYAQWLKESEAVLKELKDLLREVEYNEAH